MCRLSQETIAQLSRMGVGGMLSELVEGEGSEDGDCGSEDEEAKAPTAEDFADITELAAEDEMTTAYHSTSNERLFQKGVSFATSQLMTGASAEDDDDYDMDTQASSSQTPHDSLPDSGFGSSESDSQSFESGSQPAFHSNSFVPVTSMATPPPPDQLTPGLQPPVSIEGSAIPALIPQNMSLEELHAKVKKLFPSFKPNGILRFSSIFGPGKPSSLPRIWQGARKPRRRKGRRGRGEGGSPREWRLDVDCEVTADMCMSDDEVGGLLMARDVHTIMCIIPTLYIMHSLPIYRPHFSLSL